MDAVYDGFSVVQGATFDETLAYADEITHVAISLTGYTAVFELKKDYGDALPALRLTTENGGVVINGAAGTVRVIITDEQSATLPADGLRQGLPYVYDLKLVSGTGVAEKLLRGIFTVFPGVS